MEIFDNTLMTLALGGLAVSLALFASAWLYPHLRRAWDKATALARAVFCGAVAVACLYGGAKHGGTISYPKTDTDVAYLVDSGSYVTNDAVHVAFTRVPTVPDTATFYLDYCAIDATNAQGVATNWVNAKTATFADLTVPFDFAFAAATNYNWMAYTDWTPGPAVQTNGVWHAYWGVDKNQGRYFIPVRTCVRDGGEVIATPKSRWIATSSPDAYVQDGLVAMWDGEWNAGRFEHSDGCPADGNGWENRTKWIDLVGGVEISPSSFWYDNSKGDSDDNSFTYTASPRFDKNSLVCARYTDRIQFHNMTNVAPQLASVEWIEIAFQMEAQTNRYTNFFIGFNNGRGPNGIGANGWSSNYIQAGATQIPFEVDRRARHSVSHGNCSKSGWIDGVAYTGTGGGWDSSYAGVNEFAINQTGSWCTKGRVYSIRLYARELTEAEVLHNYEIDRRRFGIGED